MSKAKPTSRKTQVLRQLSRSVFRTPLTIAGTFLFMLFLIVTLAAPLFTPYNSLSQDLRGALKPPSMKHWAGTDELGRDIFSRIITASRIDLFIAFGGILIALCIAIPLALAAGYFRGKTDAVISTITDSFLTFPQLVMAIILVSLLGPGINSLIVAVAVRATPALIRLIRGIVFSIASMDFVEAARALGCGNSRLLGLHILPNVMGRTLVYASVLVSQSVLTVTALGFLGIGVQPPQPEWGNMLSTSRTYLFTASWLMVYPGLAIALFILSMNILGDVLRDFFDPKEEF